MRGVRLLRQAAAAWRLRALRHARRAQVVSLFEFYGIWNGDPPGRRFTYRVVKRHKRLWIERLETGELIYTPPNFLRLVNRDGLVALAEHLSNGGDYIKAVIAFESATPRKG